MKWLRLNWQSTFDAARGIRVGMISSVQVVEACVAQVTGGEPHDG